METVFGVLKMAWGFFSEVQVPALNISFANLFLGVAVVNFSIRILKPLLGIGGSAARDGGRLVARGRSSKPVEPPKEPYYYTSTWYLGD